MCHQKVKKYKLHEMTRKVDNENIRYRIFYVTAY